MNPDFRCGIMRIDETTLVYSIGLAQQVYNVMELTQKICFIGDSKVPELTNASRTLKNFSHFEIL